MIQYRKQCDDGGDDGWWGVGGVGWVVIVAITNDYRPATTRLSRQVRNHKRRKTKEKDKTQKAQWENRVIINQ